ncbi:hypothetical protein [Natronorubrum thiooxidans]|uniref:Uncharacterized protein n=1 Tax=Natronorubrum thiooxidans TaxID=308853 RepID=A0A1N7C1H8_9EURY|nr:hypothetical protein [Natronorubrum thiooxidans]SIR57439.1 hypothetical protein SAMN05421752_10157 [Natronorubrum thiooxidans]
MHRASWWYGIALFPVVVLTAVTSRFAATAFFSAASAPDAPLGLDVAWFVLQTLSFWVGIGVAVVVLGCLLADLRALGGNETWSPSPLWGLAGVVHFGGVVFTELLLVSVPALSYYLYRRHVHVGSP